MSEIKLKPCPFCGGEAKYMDIRDIVVSKFVTCTKCGIETKRNYLRRSYAIQAWNTRKPMDAIVEALNDAGNQRVENAFGGREEWEALAYRQGTRKAIELMKGGTT